jgi:energy-coupling factor transporter ATP-binding protein EcfA2
MLTLDRISYRYAGARVAALLDVSLTLGPGEVVGLLGASESGKTTLCLVAAGLAPRTVGGTLRGRLLLEGEDTAGLPIHSLVDRVGMAFSSPATQLTGVADTVYEEVAFGPMNLGLPRSEVIARTGAALEALRIEALAERDPARLSGGQQQLVGIAGLLALGPAHLVLDEPTAQLDPTGTRMVADALERLAANGASILIAEQKTDLVAELCSRVVVLGGGRLVRQGATAEVLDDPALAALGVAPPARSRLGQALATRGISSNLAERLRSALATGAR